MSLDKLTEMSNKYGSDEEYVLAGGGNTSYKSDGILYVKASGTQLANVKPELFVKMDMNKLMDMLVKTYPETDDEREAAALADMMLARLPGEESKRPSVESILHAIFPYKYVLHVHPALINGLTCGKKGEKACKDLLGDNVVWIGLTKPGYILSLVCKNSFEAKEKEIGYYPKVALLQNHGIFFAADTTEEIDDIVNSVFGKLKTTVKLDFKPVEYDVNAAVEATCTLRMLYSKEGNAAANFYTDKQVMGFVSDLKSFEKLVKPFSPDHIVYCKDEPLFVEEDANIKAAFEAYVQRKGYLPKIAAIQGLGFVAMGAGKKEANTAKALFLDAIKIAVYSKSFGGPLPLPDDFTDFILNWEIESYRSKTAFSDVSQKRLQGKIAVVTGSAQGFGKGIAEELAKAGAYVVISDINYEGAKKCSDEINKIYGLDASMPIVADVSDENSVRDMINQTVLHYGGLDLFISNAGVLKAGSVLELDKAYFDFVNSINYTGYFLCAKHASRVMSVQNANSPDYLTDIIEINSKSGLEGSNKNFAYAGSKFGGIGLTQSFAMELIEYGIKVNAVCPGNYLNGPMWSDPVNGLFRQYLDTGKVKGAKTLADVRKFYENLSPMKRGCEVIDVARAIFYAVEQRYETGQAIPVTGGQVMLK